jgi:uncharacterized membrane protein (DUF373 family)
MSIEDNGVRPTETASADVSIEGYANEPLLRLLNRVINMAVRVLAVLMTLVIVFGVLDVVWVMYELLATPPYLILRMSDILTLFGAFLAVLIAVEIFINITIYLREDVIHVKIVMATALMAIARKVIILDIKDIEPEFVYGIAAVVLAMSVGYWLVVVRAGKALEVPRGHPTGEAASQAIGRRGHEG